MTVGMRTSAATRFTLVLLAMLAALVGVQIVGLAAQRSADRAADSRVQLARGVEQIRYYDELLTMSARLAAVTGDHSYVQRYRKAVPELDRVIAEALAVAPDASADDAVRATGRANQALIALEEESFRRLAGRERAGAYAAVSSSDYGRLKAEYQNGMDVAVERLQVAVARQRTQATRRQQVSLGVGAGAAALLALLWAATFRGLRRSQHARRRVEEQLRLQAHSDPLTRLAEPATVPRAPDADPGDGRHRRVGGPVRRPGPFQVRQRHLRPRRRRRPARRGRRTRQRPSARPHRCGRRTPGRRRVRCPASWHG